MATYKSWTEWAEDNIDDAVEAMLDEAEGSPETEEVIRFAVCMYGKNVKSLETVLNWFTGYSDFISAMENYEQEIAFCRQHDISCKYYGWTEEEG